MPETLGVPEEMLEDVRAFVRERKIPLEVTADGNATVTVAQSAGRRESGRATLESGGWIACPIALAMAGRLGIEPLQLGVLLDFLDVKVRACSLGCFK